MKIAPIFASGAARQLQKGFASYKKGDNPAAVFHFTRAARFFKVELQKAGNGNGSGRMDVDKYLENESKLRLSYAFRANAYSRIGNETRARISQELADRLID